MPIFGDTDPRKMPAYLFWGIVSIDYSTAVRANTERQNYSVCPRHWYIDVDLRCERCSRHFTWTAAEQQVWFEDYGFWIDSQPRDCRKCRADRRYLAALRREYDATVAAARSHGSPEQKARIIQIVAELQQEPGTLPEKMIATSELFARQLSKQAD